MSIGNFSSTRSALPNAETDMYTDLNSLQKIKQLGRGDNSDKQQALEAVAKQFESVFLNMMMKSMREANEAFKDDAMSSSNEMDFYQNMFDQQLALTLSKDGVGIADALMRQLQRQLPQAPESVKSYGQNTFDLYDDLRKMIEAGQPVVTTPDVEKAQKQSAVKDSAAEAITKDLQAINSLGDFKKTLLPMAEKAAQKLGVDPAMILSQAALETGWGKHMINKPNGESSFNLFGIKAGNGWQGDTATVKTLEYENGIAKRQSASFRSYSSYEESFNDYVDFIKGSGRYQDALKADNDSGDYVRHLQQAGYATDPNYANKIIDIANRHFQSNVETVSGGQG